MGAAELRAALPATNRLAGPCASSPVATICHVRTSPPSAFPLLSSLFYFIFPLLYLGLLLKAIDRQIDT